ncbi:MAG: alanine racemase [Candidatus Eremiobacteraeota bacterium]|nr:alanine racemase [Candidatus Eremiobacteraeota bacterium]
MEPAISLDGDTLRANVAAFAALGAPVAAVVKHDGYGWGARRLARELDGVVESYFVSDEDELAALRPATAKPVRLLTDAPPGRLGRVLDLNGIPNVASRASLAEAAGEAARRGGLTVRIGILDAAGWSSIRPQEAPAFAAAVAGTGLAVELWTHVTSVARAGAILDGFVAATRAFEAAGVRVASTDAAGTASARRGLAFDRLRVGVGLFGSRLGSSVDNACALRVVAPVVRQLGPGEVAWAGYGDTAVAANRSVAVLRCGYGDGFPKALADGADILSIGMQYTARVMRDGLDVRALIGGGDDLDGLAARAGISSHELVVGLAWK